MNPTKNSHSQPLTPVFPNQPRYHCGASDPEETIRQLNEIYNDFTICYPEHTQSIPTVRPGEDPLVACIRSMVKSMEKKSISLDEARIEAQNAANVKEEFLANMSHEVRTPLNGIFGLVNALIESKKDLNPAQVDDLETILRCSEHLLNVLNDVLDISKISADKLELRPRGFELKSVIDDLLLIHGSNASDKMISLELDIKEDVATHFKGDDLRLKQILGNLLSNAIKFSDVGGAVKIQAQIPYPEHKNYVMFSIEDSGIGIDPESAKTIFEPFTQANSSMSRHHQGTGLGLAICKNIVDLMEGQIWVDTEHGVGSVFSFTCLFEQYDEIKDPRVTPLRRRENSDQEKLVMLVEDNMLNRRVAGMALSKLNCKVIEANNGKQAVVLAADPDFDFDFICMDVCMPEMDGIEATRKIRELGQRNRSIPIIAMTGMAFDEDREKCLNAGMDEVITKPFSIDELREKIEALEVGDIILPG